MAGGLNHYTELLNYMKGLLDADPLVNTITNSTPDKIDWDKMNIFPLVNISINDGSFTSGSTIKFSVEIASLDVRDKNNEISVDKFWNQDNEVDNLNEMLAVLNRLWTVMYVDFNDRDITSSENPTFNAVREENSNVLDGWVLTFDVEMPNTTMSLCS